MGLFTAIKKGESVIPLDARKAASFQKEHIPGAISLPHREIDEKSTRKLNKSVLYVSYCTGNGCNASTWGALKLAKLGFRVKELFGGIECWKAEGYATEGTHSSKGTVAEATREHLQKRESERVQRRNQPSA